MIEMSMDKKPEKRGAFKAKYKEYEDFGKLPQDVRRLFGGYIAYVELAEGFKNDEVVHDYYRLKSEKIAKRIEKRLKELGRL